MFFVAASRSNEANSLLNGSAWPDKASSVADKALSPHAGASVDQFEAPGRLFEWLSNEFDAFASFLCALDNLLDGHMEILKQKDNKRRYKTYSFREYLDILGNEFNG